MTVTLELGAYTSGHCQVVPTFGGFVAKAVGLFGGQ